KANFRVSMLAHYHDGSPATQEELAESAKHVSCNYAQRFLILFSTSYTGGSIGRVKLSLESLRCPSDKVSFVVLYSLSEGPIVARGDRVRELCAFPDAVHADSSSEEGSGSHDKSTIEIDPRTYFPRLVQEREQQIRSATIRLNKDFFD